MQKVDIVFSFDTTGSMYPCISEVRRRVNETVGRIFKELPGVRIGVIAHGDYCDKNRTYVIKKTPLTRGLKTIEKFVTNCGNTDGGDWEECYEWVLATARTGFEWREDAVKILVMIADATPHPKAHYDRRYARQGWPYIDWKEQCRLLASEGIQVYSVQAMGARRSTSFYETMAKMTGGVKLDLQQLSNIVQYIMAIAYKQESDEKLDDYGEELYSQGMFNRGIVAMLNTLQCKGPKATGFVEYDKSDLIPVHPSRFQVFTVEDDKAIKAFVEDMGISFKQGQGFYEHSKSVLVQEKKEVILVDRETGDMFSGEKARELMGLPYGERGKITIKAIKDLGYRLFIQSTSVNRKLLKGTGFLYEVEDWERYAA